MLQFNSTIDLEERFEDIEWLQPYDSFSKTVEGQIHFLYNYCNALYALKESDEFEIEYTGILDVVAALYALRRQEKEDPVLKIEADFYCNRSKEICNTIATYTFSDGAMKESMCDFIVFTEITFEDYLMAFNFLLPNLMLSPMAQLEMAATRIAKPYDFADGYLLYEDADGELHKRHIMTDIISNKYYLDEYSSNFSYFQKFHRPEKSIEKRKFDEQLFRMATMGIDFLD